MYSKYVRMYVHIRRWNFNGRKFHGLALPKVFTVKVLLSIREIYQCLYIWVTWTFVELVVIVCVHAYVHSSHSSVTIDGCVYGYHKYSAMWEH